MSQTSNGGMPPSVNAMMKFILRSPLHGLVSKSIMLITFTGQKSGKSYTTPVSYVRDGDCVTMFTHGRWWKNLQEGAPVTLRIRGQEMKGRANPIAEDKAAVAAGLQKFLQTLPRDAKYYGVTLGTDGQPNADQVAQAAKDAIMINIQLKEA